MCIRDSYEYDTQRTKIVSNEGHNVYGLASGWRYDFPWIETVTLTEDEGWGKNPAYLHYGSAGGIGIETEADDATKTYSIKGLEGYDYDDIKLEDWDKTCLLYTSEKFFQPMAVTGKRKSSGIIIHIMCWDSRLKRMLR